MTDAREPEIDSNDNQKDRESKKISVSCFGADRRSLFHDPWDRCAQESKSQEGDSSLAPARVGIQPKLFGKDRHCENQDADHQKDGYGC